jgi:ferredoxin
VFELGDDNIAKVKVEEVPADAQQAAQDAAATCPVTCITLTE